MCNQALANFFIKKSNKDKMPITNMKLQKLMFIGYGWVLALTDDDIALDEAFEAWQHGPVLPSIYHEMKHYGDTPIEKYATTYDFDDNVVYEPKIKTDQTKAILDKVWAIYKTFSAWSLRDLTHEDGTPWRKNYSGNSQYTKIPKKEVEAYYADYIKNLLDLPNEKR